MTARKDTAAPPARGRAAATRPPGASRLRRSAAPSRRPPGAVSFRRLAVLGVIIVVLAITVFPTVRSYLSQRGQISALQQQTAQQQRAVADAQRTTALWSDKAYIQQQARQRLKLVMPGEKSYIVLNGVPSTSATRPVAGVTGVSAAIRRTHPWYGQMWSSIKSADQPAAAAHPAVRRSTKATGKAKPGSTPTSKASSRTTVHRPSSSPANR